MERDEITEYEQCPQCKWGMSRHGYDSGRFNFELKNQPQWFCNKCKLIFTRAGDKWIGVSMTNNGGKS